MNEGNSGSTTFTFTVTLSDPPPGNFTITVNYATANDTATGGATCPGSDYVNQANQLTFNRNNLTRPVAVVVCGDAVAEADETFFVNLFGPNPSSVAITKPRGVGTIRNDDGALTRPTTTSVSCDPPTVGIASNCTATVTDTGSGIGTSPLGTVNWSSSPGGAFAPNSCTLTASGVGTSTCTVSYTPTTAGTAVVTAAYTGSVLHLASQGQATVQVARRATSTSVACSPPTVAVDETTTCTATVTDSSGGAGSTPTGTVSWTSDGAGGFSAASCTLDAGGKCSVSYTPTAIGNGTHKITASYGGDATHNGSAGSSNVAVTRRTTSTSVSCAPPSVAVGVTTTCTATVTDTSGGTKTTPGGTVGWSSGGSGSFSAATCTLDATGKCSVDYTPTAIGAGTHTIAGTYGGDAKHSGSAGSFNVTVGTRSTSTSVSCSPNAVAVGEPTTCTATVTDTTGGVTSTPGGTVSWSSNGAGTFSAATCTLDGDGKCSVDYTPTAIGTGTHEITGDYGGDATHSGSSGTDTVAAGKRTSSTSVSCEPGSVAVDDATTCTATVSDPSGSTPTGTVSWSSDGAGSFSAATCTLDADGTCSVEYTPTAVGDGMHEITGEYGGDTDHAESEGSDSVLVSRRSTATSVSCVPSTVAVDTTTTCTATVTDTAGGTASTPGGTVSWTSDGTGTFSAATCTLDDGECSVQYTPTAIGTGTHELTGDYGGDAKHSGSSGSDSVTVTTRTTSTSVSCEPATVAVDAETTCTATVTDTSGGTASTPGGTVSWSSDGTGTFSSATCTLDDGECSVQYTPTAIGSGTHEVTGDYGGDAKHSGSSGSDSVTVTRRSTATSVSCSPTSFRAGTETTCTATVTDTSDGTKSTPSGTVGWSTDGTGSLSAATCTLGPAGKCSVTYSATTAGTDEITASYGGDAKHDESSGSTTVTIRPGAPASVTVAPADDTNTAGEQHCVTATVKDAYGNTVEAGVTVSFSVTGVNPQSATSQLTDANGQAEFCYTGTHAGVDTIHAVADRDDPPNGPDSGDPEGTATKTYKPGPPAKVEVAPASATNPVRTQHCVTATVRDGFDNPVQAGIDVYFSVTGANPTPTAVKVVTDGNGKAQFCYVGRNGGTDTIKAIADKDAPPNGADASDPFGTATKTWLSNIPCRVQGSGTIPSNRQFNFGVEYFAGAGSPTGSATYLDSGQGRQFTATRIDGLVCFGVPGGAHAIFFGRGLVNGVPNDFQIDIDDLGPGPGTDKFAIQWPGYTASGTLVTGDIQITIR